MKSLRKKIKKSGITCQTEKILPGQNVTNKITQTQNATQTKCLRTKYHKCQSEGRNLFVNLHNSKI